MLISFYPCLLDRVTNGVTKWKWKAKVALDCLEQVVAFYIMWWEEDPSSHNECAVSIQYWTQFTLKFSEN